MTFMASDDKQGVHVLAEAGFHYFPSPDSDDDMERIAHLFLYCETAVQEWPGYRRSMEENGARSREQSDHIERHCVNVFRELRDKIAEAIDTNNLALISDPRLGDCLLHASATLALYAEPSSLLEYRRMILPELDGLPPSEKPQEGDFHRALWDGKWNTETDQLPAKVTLAETRRSRHLHENDGLYNTNGRLDPPALAGELDPLFPATEPIMPLSELQLAFVRARLRLAGKRAGLKKEQIDFLVRMALDGAKQEDNPTAWRAIRDRKRAELWDEVQSILAYLR